MYKGELREEIAEMIKKSQKEKPLADLLREYIRSDRVSLHIPGHKGGGGISEGTAQLEELFSREVCGRISRRSTALMIFIVRRE